jgi:hypothetical protein
VKGVVRVPILNDEYWVIVCWGEPSEINKVLKDYHYPGDVRMVEWRVRGACFSREACHPVVALPAPPRTTTEIATLCHEAIHAACHVLDTVDAKIDGEILAHSVGAIVRKTLEYISKTA